MHQTRQDRTQCILLTDMHTVSAFAMSDIILNAVSILRESSNMESQPLRCQTPCLYSRRPGASQKCQPKSRKRFL